MFENLDINMHKNEIVQLFYTRYKRSMQYSKVLSFESQNYRNTKDRRDEQC